MSKKSQEFFPVGIVPAGVSKALNTNGHKLLLSQETLITHLKKHSDIKLANYAAMQKIIDNSQAVLRGREVHFIQQDQPGKFLRAVVKAVDDSDEIFLNTIHRMRASQAEEFLSQEKL